jgi:hypothetical protein
MTLADIGALREAAAAVAAVQAGATLQDEVAGLASMDEDASMQAEIEAHYKVRQLLVQQRTAGQQMLPPAILNYVMQPASLQHYSLFACNAYKLL